MEIVCCKSNRKCHLGTDKTFCVQEAEKVKFVGEGMVNEQPVRIQIDMGP